jgi:hypothetical protein
MRKNKTNNNNNNNNINLTYLQMQTVKERVSETSRRFDHLPTSRARQSTS